MPFARMTVTRQYFRWLGELYRDTKGKAPEMELYFVYALQNHI